MNLEQAKKVSLKAIKQLWDNDIRYVSVKRIKQVEHVQEAQKTNIILGKALKRISLNTDFLRQFGKSPNKYKILKKPDEKDLIE